MPSSQERKRRLRLLSQWCLSSLSPRLQRRCFPLPHCGLPGSLAVSSGAHTSPGQPWQEVGGSGLSGPPLCLGTKVRGAEAGKRNVYKVIQMVTPWGDVPRMGPFGPGGRGLQQSGASRGLCQPQAVRVARVGSRGRQRGKGGLADGTGPGHRRLRGPYSYKSRRRSWHSGRRGHFEQMFSSQATPGLPRDS